MNDEEIIKRMGLPSWYTPEMLRPGVPVVKPADDKTTITDEFGIHEAWPGAWSGVKRQRWWQFWKRG